MEAWETLVDSGDFGRGVGDCGRLWEVVAGERQGMAEGGRGWCGVVWGWQRVITWMSGMVWAVWALWASLGIVWAVVKR